MVQSSAETVEAYLASLPEERRAAVETVRQAILERLPEGYEEAMQYGMISYRIPLSRYPQTYNGQPLAVASLGAQKSHMAVYLHNVYAEPGLTAWFEAEYRKSGKRMDMGKSCVRFRRIEDLPVELIGEAVARTPPEAFIALQEAIRKPGKRRP